MNTQFSILLYYKYVSLKNPAKLVAWHKGFCAHHGIKGRIIIATEGINGTLEGTVAATELYMKELKAWKDADSQPFSDLLFKISEGNGSAFPKLSVKLRTEIVSSHLGEKDIDPNRVTGKRLTPEELKKWIDEGRDFSIVDMRNTYEFKSGHFKGSIDPGMDNFRDLPNVMPKLEPLKEKAVLTVCTGGVRCEKASGFLVSQGFKDVYQLDGGIVSYMNKYPGKDFLGALYVFDNRLTMDTTKDREIVGRCDQCEAPTEHYENCANMGCHDHILVCLDCVAKTEGRGYCRKCAHLFSSKAVV